MRSEEDSFDGDRLKPMSGPAGGWEWSGISTTMKSVQCCHHRFCRCTIVASTDLPLVLILKD
jgi:hypothetical protein